MDNFQLYRTNLLLGGQMKWDLVVGNTNSELFVSDFHLTPISNNIPFAFKSEETLLNNKHHENVRSYYNVNKGNFYNEGLDSEFCNNWPLMYSDDILKYPNMHSNIYDMGCKRMHSFKRYNKQFEFFCPVWIEHLTDDITFNVTISNIINDKSQTKNVIASRQLTLKKIGIKYHDEFVKYFNDYIKYIGLDNGSDDLLDISLDNYTANVTGLNVTNGLVVIKSNADLVNNILSRERPLLETDDMLINMFSDNKLICKQLFNFNICFNLYDILPNAISRQIIGENISVSVNVKIGNETLKIKDFDTNYEFIQRQYTVGDNIELSYKYDDSGNITNEDDVNKNKNALKLNVFDYLHDNECVDLIAKNKFCQSRCHWSLNDNNDYIFNVYNGFSGFHIDKDTDTNTNTNVYHYYENNHQYGTTPNTLLDKYSKTDNSTGWINIENFKPSKDDGTIQYNEFYANYIVDFKNKMYNGTLFYDNIYVNNIRYTSTFKDHIKDYNENSYHVVNTNPLYVLGIIVSDELLKSSNLQKHGMNIKGDNDISKYIVINFTNKDTNNDILYVITNSIDNFTFYNFKNNIKNYYNNTQEEITDEKIYKMSKTLNCLNSYLFKNIDPKVVKLNSSLKYYIANGPSNDITEITYCKDNITTEYVLRHDGKLRPTFIDNISQHYIKKAFKISDDTIKNIYGKYSKKQLEPLYPSIDYCAIHAIENCNSESYHEYEISIGENTYLTPIEYSWFNSGKCLVLKDQIEFDIWETNLTKDTNILKAVENRIKQYYWNIVALEPESEYIDETYETYDKIKLQFIYSIYSIDYDHIYENNQYKYHITLTLK